MSVIKSRKRGQHHGCW